MATLVHSPWLRGWPETHTRSLLAKRKPMGMFQPEVHLAPLWQLRTPLSLWRSSVPRLATATANTQLPKTEKVKSGKDIHSGMRSLLHQIWYSWLKRNLTQKHIETVCSAVFYFLCLNTIRKKLFQVMWYLGCISSRMTNAIAFVQWILWTIFGESINKVINLGLTEIVLYYNVWRDLPVNTLLLLLAPEAKCF